MYVYTVKMYCRSELTQHTVVHLLATYLPTFFLWWIKKKWKEVKNYWGYNTYGKSRLCEVFIFAISNNDDTAKS